MLTSVLTKIDYEASGAVSIRAADSSSSFEGSGRGHSGVLTNIASYEIFQVQYNFVILFPKEGPPHQTPQP